MKIISFVVYLQIYVICSRKLFINLYGQILKVNVELKVYLRMVTRKKLANFKVELLLLQCNTLVIIFLWFCGWVEMSAASLWS